MQLRDMPQNIRLLVEYDGTPYVGWQLQDGLPTVQGELLTALRSITGEADLQLNVAGRTDAGVHAYGQVVSFLTRYPKEPRRLAPALNFYLPSTIRIHRAEGVPDDFDARRSAKGKRYRYRVYSGPHPLAVERDRVWHVRRHLNLDAMRQAAAHLIGELDFESFRSSHCDAAHAVRTMFAIPVEVQPRPPVGSLVDITFHANAFCRHMCRILAGTLVEVGAGKRTPADVAHVLARQERAAAGITAPPAGLTLLEVFY